MALLSHFDELNKIGAILEVKMDEVKLLGPGDRRKAIGTQDLNGCSALVVLGTGKDNGIVMAHIGPRPQPGASSGSSSAGSPRSTRSPTPAPVTSGEKLFMKKFRQLTATIFEQRALFSLPLAWSVLGSFEGDVPLSHLQQRAKEAFATLKIPATEITYEVLRKDAARRSGKGTVVAVRNDPHGPELYVEDELAYPKDNTGALELEFDRLGISTEREEGKEEDEGDEESDEDEEKEGNWYREGDGQYVKKTKMGREIARQAGPPLKIPFAMGKYLFKTMNGEDRFKYNPVTKDWDRM